MRNITYPARRVKCFLCLFAFFCNTRQSLRCIEKRSPFAVDEVLSAPHASPPQLEVDLDCRNAEPLSKFVRIDPATWNGYEVSAKRSDQSINRVV